MAHGKGVLYVIDNDSVIEQQVVEAYYGALDENEIVSVSDTETYVGGIIDEKFNGYGVYNKNGEIYIGNFKDSKPHGFAIWYKNGKPYYEGMWANGNFHGEGTLYKEDGSIKTGDWDNGTLIQTLVDVEINNGHYNGYVKNNKPDGIGKMEYADGSVYSGKWKDGSYNGTGVYVNGIDTIVGDWEYGKVCGDILYRSEQFFYEGSMVDNIPTGIGNLTIENNSFYTGNWVDGKRAGIGDIFFANGDSYSGEWVDNQFSGTGKYIYDKQKASYEGEWLDGLQNGQGYYRCPEFAYRGEWEKGWMDGEGTLVFKNGDKYEGTVHENLIDGIGTYTFKDGNFYEGEFVEGQMSGLGIFHFKNGTTFEGEFLNGKIYGDGTLNLVEGDQVVSITGFWTPDGKFPANASILFPSGDLYEGPIINGHPTDEGIWISGEERAKDIDKIENSSLHKANEFYKRNRDTFDWCLMGASTIVTAIEIASASTVVLAPVAAVAQGINMGINVIDAGLAVGSAAMDAGEAYALGEDTSEQLTNLSTEVALNAAFIVVPKAAKAITKLGKPLKNVTRSAAASLGFKSAGKLIAKKSAIKFVKGKVYGKTIQLSLNQLKNGCKSIEKKVTRKIKTSVVVGRILTRSKHQTIFSNAFFSKLRNSPELQKQLNLTSKGDANVLRTNMLIIMGKEGRDWMAKNIKIARQARKKLQVEAHHILTSTPTTAEGKRAKEIFEKYFGSIDHPSNGFFAGRGHGSEYVGLAKGSSHAKHSNEYNAKIQQAIIKIEEDYGKKYTRNPEIMQKLILEQLDDFKRDIYKGKLHITGASHEKHTVISVFKQSKGVVNTAMHELFNSRLIPSL
ncbi:MAG: AHH domain-containing protein [Muribaculaceae bacterium]|nr:AHH domain-containing protein [Muribaculaceae bacterium]